MLLADSTAGKVKAVNINPTLTVTSGTSEATPKIKIAVGGVESSEQSLNSATTSAYGATILTNTASSTEEAKAATPKLVSSAITSAINALDVTNSAENGKYVSTVSEADGKISVTKASFSPSVTVAQGTTADDVPTINITVAGTSGTAQAIPAATTSSVGVTKLNSTPNNADEATAATPKLVATAISNAVNGLDVTDSAVAGQYVSAVSETNGAIAVTRASFSPSVTVAQGATADDAPTIAITVGGATATAQALPAATTSSVGVIKLDSGSNASSKSNEATAMTPKGV